MLDRIFGPLARRWKWAATALAVQKRFAEIKGNYLASAVTLNLFVSIFPLLLVAIAILGFVTNNNIAVVLDALNQLGLTGEQRETVEGILQRAADTRKAASVVGLATLLWTGLGVAAAIEYAMDSTWQATGRGIKDKLRGIVWGLGALILMGGSVGLVAVAEHFLDGVLSNIAVAILGVGINIAFWLWTFLSLAYNRVAWKAYLPGAILAGVGLEILKQVLRLVPGVIGNSTVLYGSLGTVFAALATLALLGRLLVYASTLNVIRWEGDKGTVTVDIEVPKIPGQVPIEADRGGAVEPPVAGT